MNTKRTSLQRTGRQTFTSYGQLHNRQVSNPVNVKHIPKKFIAGMAAVFILFLAGHGLLAMHASAATEDKAHAVARLAIAQNERTKTFASQMNAIIAANPQITMSVAVTPLDISGNITNYGSSAVYDAASTGKLITASDYLRHVQNGTAKLTTQIDGDSAQYLLKIMIVNSDDTAWAELNDYLTHPDLQRFAASIGITDYDASTNNLAATDTAGLLQKLYNNQLLSNANRSLLLSYLQQANYRDYIVPAVPKGDTVYHKVGLDGDNVHDAAIITDGSKAYVLVIYTNGNGTYDWPDRALLMQQITRDATAAYL